MAVLRLFGRSPSLRRRSAPQTSAVNPFPLRHQPLRASAALLLFTATSIPLVERGYMVADIIVLNSTKNVKLFLLETAPNRSDGKAGTKRFFTGLLDVL